MDKDIIISDLRKALAEETRTKKFWWEALQDYRQQLAELRAQHDQRQPSSVSVNITSTGNLIKIDFGNGRRV